MAYAWLHDGTEIAIEPADLTTDQRDIVLMLTALAEIARQPDVDARAACERVARLVLPYVSGATVEQLAASFAADTSTMKLTLHRVLLFFLFDRRSPTTDSRK